LAPAARRHRRPGGVRPGRRHRGTYGHTDGWLEEVRNL
jgi:hypothetical protein